MFQFPSNGKADPKSNIVGAKGLRSPLSFNSLQTGKRIQRSLKEAFSHCGLYTIVSIPFKRESGSKGLLSLKRPNPSVAWESGSTSRQCRLLIEFQFPSNGKADPKVMEYLPLTCERILEFSIPFKRESGSKASKKVLSGIRTT